MPSTAGAPLLVAVYADILRLQISKTFSWFVDVKP